MAPAVAPSHPPFHPPFVSCYGTFSLLPCSGTAMALSHSCLSTFSLLPWHLLTPAIAPFHSCHGTFSRLPWHLLNFSMAPHQPLALFATPSVLAPVLFCHGTFSPLLFIPAMAPSSYTSSFPVKLSLECDLQFASRVVETCQ